MKKIILALIMLILTNIAMAQEIEVTKDSVPEIRLNEIIEINIRISNSYDSEKEVMIEEILPQDIQVISPEEFFIKKNDALELKYYEWITKISPNSIKTISYKIKPLSLSQYSIGSTEVIDKSNSRVYSSNTLTFNVKCIPNNKCEVYESSNTCPEDCQTGAKDGICDYKADGICDKDCSDEPDCKKSNFNINYIIIPLGILIIIIIIFIIFSWLFKKKQEITQNTKTESTKETINNDLGNFKNQEKNDDPLKGL